MKIDLFNTQKAQLLKRSLDMNRKQYQAIAKNIANMNNPDYQRTSTDFSHVLEENQKSSKVMNTTNVKHIRSANISRTYTSAGNEGNEEGVELNQEMTLLVENQLKFEFSARMLNKHYRGLSKAILGRNR